MANVMEGASARTEDERDFISKNPFSETNRLRIRKVVSSGRQSACSGSQISTAWTGGIKLGRNHVGQIPQDLASARARSWGVTPVRTKAQSIPACRAPKMSVANVSPNATTRSDFRPIRSNARE